MSGPEVNLQWTRNSLSLFSLIPETSFMIECFRIVSFSNGQFEQPYLDEISTYSSLMPHLRELVWSGEVNLVYQGESVQTHIIQFFI